MVFLNTALWNQCQQWQEKYFSEYCYILAEIALTGKNLFQKCLVNVFIKKWDKTGQGKCSMTAYKCGDSNDMKKNGPINIEHRDSLNE